MKTNRLLLLCLLLFATAAANAQSVQRNVVVLEIGTGTWCQYCPGASNAADQLIAEGKNVAVIENHNGDVYANVFSNTRNNYYALTGYPTGNFDGTVNYPGGQACPTGNIYSTYLPMYNSSYAVPSPITLCFSGSNTGNTYTINVSVTKLNTYTGNDLRLQLVLTESHIPVSWQGCMTEVNFVNRLMTPDVNGTAVSFASNTTQLYTLTFQKDPSWDASHCELVAFVQDNTTKEIFNAVKSPLNSMPSSAFALNDFSASVTSGCAPLSVDFSTTQASNVTYHWSFESGTPATSTLANPTVSYTTSGSYNVTLTGTNGVCYDSKLKTDFINPLAAPEAPAVPAGATALCTNPSNQSYISTSPPYTISYIWELTPAAAGVVTPNGAFCDIDWNNTWTGTAQLRMKCANSCGTGNWSAPLNITINAIPGQCTMPAGATSLCAHSSYTQYSTTGMAPTTVYYWELTPESAGTFVQGNSAIYINWADDFSGQASLRVRASNGNCDGVFSDALQIMVNGLPTAFIVGGGGIYCGQGGSGMPVELSGSQANTNYTLYKDGVPTSTVVAGTGNAISFGNQTAANAYTAQASSQSGCSSGMTGSVNIIADPQAPEKPTDPAGPSLIITTSSPTSEFVSQSTFARSYVWNITPAQSGTISGTNETALITWNQAYIGTSSIKVQGVNTCGSSTFSNEKVTSVNIGVGLPDYMKSTLRLAPNPASNSITLFSSQEMVCDMSIVNLDGKIMVSKPSLNIAKETSIDVSMLSSGIYNLILRNQAGTRILKMVIEK